MGNKSKSEQFPNSEVPEKFFLESVNGATNTLGRSDEEVSWGGQVFEPTAVLHFEADETHYYASVKEGDQWHNI